MLAVGAQRTDLLLENLFWAAAAAAIPKQGILPLEHHLLAEMAGLVAQPELLALNLLVAGVAEPRETLALAALVKSS
jgi:hypothetical protein